MVTAIIISLLGVGGFFIFKPFITKVLSVGSTLFDVVIVFVKLLPVILFAVFVVWLIFKFVRKDNKPVKTKHVLSLKQKNKKTKKVKKYAN